MLRADPGLTIPGKFRDIGVDPYSGKASPVPADVVSCAQLATIPVLGRCPAGATAAKYVAGAYSPYSVLGGMSTTGITWPAANVPAARLGALGVDAVNVGTDGSTAAIEQQDPA